MKVLHVIPSMSPIYGGPSVATRQMAESLASPKIEVDLATTTANGRAELRVPLDRPLMDGGVRYFYFPRQHPKSWTFSWPLTCWLARHAHTYDVLHVHALFSYPTLPACWAARRAGVPYVLSPHGMLDPWSLRFRAWKKGPYLRVLERRNLWGAAAIHAVSHREHRAVEALGLPIPAVTIPYGVQPPAVRDSESTSARGRAADDVVNILFLSRLHPKKGMELLLDAVAGMARSYPVRLIVAGDGEPAYVAALKRRAAIGGLDGRVVFVGFVGEAERDRLFAQADLFVLPSYDENFGMAVVEAMSAGVPVVVSEHVALADQVRKVGAGLVVPCDEREIARAMATLVTNSELRHQMSQAARQLVKAEFSWTEIGRQLAALYEQVVALSHLSRGGAKTGPPGGSGSAGDGNAYRPCPLCGSGGAVRYDRAGPLGLHRCVGCSLVYMGQAADIGARYDHAEREYFGEGYLRKRDLFANWFHQHKARRRLRVIRRYKQGGRLLDVGCGGAELLWEARNAGYDVVGVDVSSALTAHGRQRFGLEIHCGDLANFNPPEPFDVVVMSHVLEHVVEPLEMLRLVRRLLAPGGVLYLATPNVACWEARLGGWAAYEPYHLSYFSPSTLRDALARSGYEIADVHTWEPLSAWLNTLVRGLLGERYSRLRLAVQHDRRGVRRPRWWIALTVLNVARVVGGFLLTPVRRFQESRLRGEELVCIAIGRARTPDSERVRSAEET